MAKSKAKKSREKLLREGRRDPANNRSSFATSEMYQFMKSKTTKTKKDIQYKQKHKSDYRTKSDGDSFYYIKNSPSRTASALLY